MRRYLSDDTRPNGYARVIHTTKGWEHIRWAALSKKWIHVTVHSTRDEAREAAGWKPGKKKDA